MKIRQVLAFAALIIGLGTASVAKADTCTNQAVNGSLTCTLGDITFSNFSVSSQMGPLSGIGLDPTGTSLAGGIATLDFEITAQYPVDIDLVYEVTSTSADLTQLDSAFNVLPGAPNPSISELACSVDPVGGICPEGDTIAGSAFINPPNTLSATFGPLSTFWIAKDITDNGFSEFED